MIQITCASFCVFSFWQRCLVSFFWLKIAGSASQQFCGPFEAFEAVMATKISGMPAFLTDKNNPAGYCVQGAIEFGMDSRRLIQRCTKPDAKEFPDAFCSGWWSICEYDIHMTYRIWYAYTAIIFEHKKERKNKATIDIWYLTIYLMIIVYCYRSILIYLRCCWWLQK